MPYLLFASSSASGSFAGSTTSTRTLPWPATANSFSRSFTCVTTSPTSGLVLAVSRNGEFLQQVLHLRHERREQRMGLRRKIAADQQRFMQLVDVVECRGRNRIEASLGHVD